MSALSNYLNAHIPAGWTKRQVIEALEEKIDKTTVYRYLAGSHSRNPPEYVLAAFAGALGCPIVELREAAGLAAGEEEPWVPPMEANRLNLGQRNALEAFIRATVNADPSVSADERLEARPGSSGGDIRSYITQLRRSGQGDLADRLEASLEITSPASQTANKSSMQ